MRNSRAFTLVELLISLSFMGIIFSLSFQMLSIGQNTFLNEGSRIEELQNARVVMGSIEQTIRRNGKLAGKVTFQKSYKISGTPIYTLQIATTKFAFDEADRVMRYTSNDGTNQLAIEIADFDASINGSQLHVYVKSQVDAKGSGMELSTDYYLRE